MKNILLISILLFFIGCGQEENNTNLTKNVKEDVFSLPTTNEVQSPTKAISHLNKD